MKFTGERVVPTDMHKNIDTYQQHLVRYVWALPFCVNKSVLDAACGTGYGSSLLETVSSFVVGIDNNSKAIEYAKAFYERNDGILLNYHCWDIEQYKPGFPTMDILVTFETIEHLNNPKKFLEWARANFKEVIGSIPVNCPGEFHKHVFSIPQIFELLHGVFGVHISVWHQFEMKITEMKPGTVIPNTGMILFRAKCQQG